MRKEVEEEQLGVAPLKALQIHMMKYFGKLLVQIQENVRIFC
jgi:hypothetical protein